MNFHLPPAIFPVWSKLDNFSLTKIIYKVDSIIFKDISGQGGHRCLSNRHIDEYRKRLTMPFFTPARNQEAIGRSQKVEGSMVYVRCIINRRKTI